MATAKVLRPKRIVMLQVFEHPKEVRTRRMNCQRKSTDRFAVGKLYLQVIKRSVALAIQCVGKCGSVLVVSRLNEELSKNLYFHFGNGSNPVLTVIVVAVVPAVRIDEFGQPHFVIALVINALEQFCDEMRNRVVRIIIGRNVRRQRRVEMAIYGLNASVTQLLNFSR
jgi:hypothetical protein